MKRKIKLLPFIGCILLALFIAAYIYLFMGTKNEDASDKVIPGNSNTNALVVYFTRSDVIKTDGVDAVSSASLNIVDSDLQGNTEISAKIIQELTGADLYSIQTKRNYRSAFAGTAMTSWIEEIFDMRPQLAAKPENLNKYDVIYVGYPIWWFNAPMAIGTFLESYDLSEKTIVPFCTSQDNDIEISMDYIKEVSGEAKVAEGLRIFDNSADKKEISEWLADNGLIQEET